MNRDKGSDKVFNTIVFIILTFSLIAVAYPLYFVVIASLSSPTEVNVGNVWFMIRSFTVEGYQRVFENSDIWNGYMNSIMYTVVGTTLNIVITIMAAYAMSRKDLLMRNSIMAIFVFTMYFSGGLIPTFLLVKNLNLLDKFWVMIFPSALSVYNVIVARTFFQTSIPDELLESATIDGCSDFKFVTSIVLPLSKAIISVLVIFYAVGHWNSYFNALIYLRDKKLYPLQLVLREILVENHMANEMLYDDELESKAMDYAELIKYGAIIVSSIPVLMLYPFLQKYFMKGVMIGAIKG